MANVGWVEERNPTPLIGILKLMLGFISFNPTYSLPISLSKIISSPAPHIMSYIP